MKEYEVAFKSLLSTGNGLFKSNGFKSQGAFRRKVWSEDISHIFRFMRLPSLNLPEHGMRLKFRVEIGVFIRSLYSESEIEIEVPEGKEDPLLCAIRTSGGFLKHSKDSCIEYFPTDDFEKAKEEFLSQIQMGIVWMEKMSNPEYWNAFLIEAKMIWYAAAAAILRNERELAGKLISQEIERLKGAGHATLVKKLEDWKLRREI